MDARKWDWETALYEGKTIDDEIVGQWRWGVEHRRIFSLDGTTWAVDYRTQPEEGVVREDDCKPYEVEAREKTITVWVRK